MTLRILLSLALLGIGVTVLSGCENEMGLEDELPQFTSTEGLTRAYYGTPPGEEVIVNATGLMSESEYHSNTQATELRHSLGLAVLELLTVVSDAQSPQEAYRMMQGFIENPPEVAQDIPEYLLGQAVAQHLYYNTDWVNPAIQDAEHRETIGKFLDILVDAYYPNPEPIAAMLKVVSQDWDADRLSNTAARALEAEQLYQDEIDAFIASCGECDSEMINKSVRTTNPKSEHLDWNNSRSIISTYTN